MWVRQCDLDAGNDFLSADPLADRLQRGVHSAAAIARSRRSTRPGWPRSASGRPSARALSRRDFLRTGSGMAAALLALNQVFGDCYEVAAEEVEDPKAFEEKWPKDQFIFDVQTHHVDVSQQVVRRHARRPRRSVASS